MNQLTSGPQLAPGYQKCALEPSVPSQLPLDGPLLYTGPFQVLFLSVQSNSHFFPRGLSKTGSPGASCQSPGHRGVSVNSSPTKCFRSCFTGHCISNPCQMCCWE